MQRTTLGLAIAAMAISGGVAVYAGYIAPQQQAAQQARKQLFDFREAQVQRLRVKTRERTLEFERSDDSPTGWQMLAPEQVPASKSTVVFLLDLLANESYERRFSAPPQKREAYGLTEPLARITVELQGDRRHTLVLGNTGLEGQSVYALRDPQKADGNPSVLLVANDFKKAVERELAGWKQPEAPKASAESETNPDG
ncbi:MAG: hypothetical protein BRC58_09320 [Cyanobacteria bacterium QS_8_64_29]|nr:MAG: hypothetical protein BRC58_09320 [Cyanobacteria bacterium QS_8_64_29]